MKHPHWSEIFFYFKEVEQQKEKLQNKKLSSEVLATTRNSLSISMNQLKNNLKQTLDETSVQLIVFALVALLDEEMKRLISSSSSQEVEWVPLQKEFFNLTNAGEKFFDHLDEALENPHFSSIVFEVFYFVLKKGFRGKYQNSLNRINKYIEFLSDKIQQPAIAKNDTATQQKILTFPKIKMKIWQYYVGAFALIAIAYAALVVQTNLS